MKNVISTQGFCDVCAIYTLTTHNCMLFQDLLAKKTLEMNPKPRTGFF